MKFLFKVIFLPILVTLAVPIAILGVGYKNAEVPKDEFESIEAIDLQSMVADELDAFLTSHDADSQIALRVGQEQANALVLSALRGQNPNFMLDGATGDDKEYVIKEANYGYQGSWIRFKEDTIEIESGVHAFLGEFTYRTSILLSFKLEADLNEIVLTLDKVNLGNLPLAWTFDISGWVIKQFSGQSIDQMISNVLGDALTLDLEARKMTINVDELITSQFEDDPDTLALVNTLFGFIEENELLDIGVEDDGIGVALNLGQLSDPAPITIIQDIDRLVDENDMQAILEAKVSSLLFSTLNASQTTPFIDLDAFTMNRIIEYMLRESSVVPGVLQEVVIEEMYVMRARVPYVTMDGDAFFLNLPISIEKNDDPTKVFKTIIKIDADPSMEGSDLVISFSGLSAGAVTLDGEEIGSILTLLGDNDLISEGRLVISDFDAQISQAGISVEGVEVTNSRLRLSITLSDLDVLEIQTFATEVITDVVSDLTTNPDEDIEAIGEQVQDVLDAITAEEDPTVLIETLVEDFQMLDDTQQQEIFALLEATLNDPENEYTLEDLFEFFPQP
ncbi:MAG: hypothetical protein K9K93_04775 [Acholeplasmataceae bacterium]|nr:hypothetical protein [Acholeplasmataceae bacterium]